MTPLTKTVRRRSEEYFRDRSKMRRIIVSIHPGGFIGLRLEKCRKEETLSISAAYRMAVSARVSFERMEKAKKKSKLVRRGKL